jgi:hypothetical protein
MKSTANRERDGLAGRYHQKSGTRRLDRTSKSAHRIAFCGISLTALSGRSVHSSSARLSMSVRCDMFAPEGNSMRATQRRQQELEGTRQCGLSNCLLVRAEYMPMYDKDEALFHDGANCFRRLDEKQGNSALRVLNGDLNVTTQWRARTGMFSKPFQPLSVPQCSRRGATETHFPASPTTPCASPSRAPCGLPSARRLLPARATPSSRKLS